MLQKLSLMADVLATAGVALGLGGSVFAILLQASLPRTFTSLLLRAPSQALLLSAAAMGFAGEMLRIAAYGEFPEEATRGLVFNGSFYARITLLAAAALLAYALTRLSERKAERVLFAEASVWLTLLLALVFGGMVSSYVVWLLWASALGIVMILAAPLWHAHFPSRAPEEK